MEQRFRRWRQAFAWCVLLAGLGAAVPAGAESRKGWPCGGSSRLTPAQRIVLCEDGPVPRLEHDLGVPAELAPRLVSLATRNWEIQQRRTFPLSEQNPVSAAERRALESDLVELLSQAPDLAAFRQEMGCFYSAERARPPAALLDLVARSADPERFALDLAAGMGQGWSQSLVWVLAVPLRAHPERPDLWVRAADLALDSPWTLAFLEEALRRLDPGSETARTVATRLLHLEIEAGFARRAVESWKRLPAGLRKRLLEAGDPSLRLDLVAAHLVVGDTRGASVLEAALPALPLEAPEEWLKPTATAWEFASEPRNVQLRRGLFSRWLRPSAEDPFPLLAETAGASERPMAQVGSLLLLGRLAERERYPAVARFAFETAAAGLKWRTPAPFPEPPPGLPARVATGIRRGEREVVELRKELEQGAAAAGRATPPVPPGAAVAVDRLISPDGDASAVFLPEIHTPLFAVDRAGRRAFVIWYGPRPRGPEGGQLRLEESGSVWSGIRVRQWIS